MGTPPRLSLDRHGQKIAGPTGYWRHHSRGRGRQGWDLIGDDPDGLSPARWHRELFDAIAVGNQRCEDEWDALYDTAPPMGRHGLNLGDGDEIRQRRTEVLGYARDGLMLGEIERKMLGAVDRRTISRDLEWLRHRGLLT